MNPHYTDFKFPFINASPWSKVFSNKKACNDAIDLLSRMLVYDPAKRITAAEGMAHSFFEDLRVPGATLPSGNPMPPLFNWTDKELESFPLEAREVLEKAGKAVATS
ncbi:hypothetical protein M9434_005975 [Picochlorum sp. BPE23]|nr:hypothetical protein M9434_005975 [Picochlorum sp. BPE23]